MNYWNSKLVKNLKVRSTTVVFLAGGFRRIRQPTRAYLPLLTTTTTTLSIKSLPSYTRTPGRTLSSLTTTTIEEEELKSGERALELLKVEEVKREKTDPITSSRKINDEYYRQILSLNGGPILEYQSADSSDQERSLKRKLALGERPNLGEFELAIESCITTHRFDKILGYLEILWELHYVTERQFYQNIFGNLLVVDSSDAIFDILRGIMERNGEEGFELSHWMFQSAVDSGEIGLAKQCYSFLFTRGYLRKNESYHRFLRCLDIDRHEVLHHCLNPNQLKQVLHGLARRQAADEILNLLGLMIEMNLELEPEYLNIALAPLIRHSPVMAMKLLEVMKRSPRTTPNFKTYFTVIRGLYLYHDMVEEAKQLESELPESLLPEDYQIQIANVLLSSSFRFRPFEATVVFYQHILNNLTPNLATFKKMARQLIKYSQATSNPLYEPNIDSIIEEITLRGIHPDGVLLTMLIKCYLRVNVRKAELTFQEIVNLNLPLDRYMHSLFIHHMAKVEKDIPAAILWLERQIDANIMPIQESIVELLGLVMRSRDVPSAIQVQTLLNRINYLPNLDDHIQAFIDQVQSGEPYLNPRPVRIRRTKYATSPVIPVAISPRPHPSLIPPDVQGEGGDEGGPPC